MLDTATVATFIRETAQTEILPRFQALRQEDIREKKPGDLVTVADLASERRLTRLLGDAAPDSVVLGEESVAQDPRLLELLGGDRPVWVIDPIDGTSNFAHGRPGFAVILAYVERGATRAGWIYDPLGDVMVTGRLGEGAWSAGRRLHVDKSVLPGEMIGSAYGRAASGVRSAELLEQSGRIGRIRNHRCSGLEYVELVLGTAHFSLHSRSLPWDHAAGMLLVAEAGGTVGFLDGSPYDPRIPDRPVLAAATPEGWQLVRDIVTASIPPR
jgi:fructose-1,6-bisphosphatase/inositol monophosphatase family enzyme